MEEKQSYLTINLDLHESIAIDDFAKHFSGLGAEFESYIASEHPEFRETATLQVREVRHGSIETDLYIYVKDALGMMNNTLIVNGFVDLIYQRTRSMIQGQFIPDISKKELNNINDTIVALANDRDGSMELSETNYNEKGQPKKKTVFKFDSDEAKKAVTTIEKQKLTMEKETHSNYERVLMVFERPSSSHKNIGASTGERVIIEELSDKPKALVYASDLAEERIKDEITHSKENIFKLGFYCDVNVKMRLGRIVCYAITNVHQIIDLPDGE